MNTSSNSFLRLDPKYFKAFVAVAEFGQFTLAAEKVAMTQSCVSQHISKLERQLGHALFQRTHKNIVVTRAGQKLLAFIDRLNHSETEFFRELNQGLDEIGGLLSCALPYGFLQSPHFLTLMAYHRQHSGLQLQLKLCSNEQVLEEILEGKCDIGFVAGKVEHSSLDYLPFCQEEYVLVTSPEEPMKDLAADSLLPCKFILYPDMRYYFDAWLSHFRPDLHEVNWRSLQYSVEINSVEGAIMAALNGAGIGIFPRHCVQPLIAAGKLSEFNYCDRPQPRRTVYIVQLHNASPAGVIEQLVACNAALETTHSQVMAI